MTRIQFGRLAPTSLLSLLVMSIARPCLATPLLLPSLNRTQVAQVNRSTIPVEQDVLAEINRARTNPRAYAEWLETLRSNYNGTILQLPGEIPIRTREGVAALDEAIAFLQAISPLSPLQHSDGMSQGAQDLVDALGQSGTVGYQGSDNSLGDRLNRYGQWGGSVSEMTNYGNRTATATVLLLILNDGNAERPLRNALFSSTARFIGVACGVHETQQTMCTLNYATTYTALAG